MASFPTRRSPRLIENLCNRIVFSPLDYEQTATVLSLAHCTGWAADQITNKVAGTFGVLIPVEILWEKHYGWVVGRDFKDLSTSEWEIMQVLMRRVGVVMAEAGRALSETPPPVSSFDDSSMFQLTVMTENDLVCRTVVCEGMSTV